MEDSLSRRGLFRFGVFELDSATGELRKQGIRIKVHQQTLTALIVMIEHAGEIVTREEFREKLWNSETFVDFERSLNTIISKAREVLGDSSTSPHYIETVPRRGYRFLASVEEVSRKAPTSGSSAEAPSSLMTPFVRRHRLTLVAILILLVAAVVLGWQRLEKQRLLSLAGTTPKSVLVLPFVAKSGPELEDFADTFTDDLINALAQIEGLHVIARTSAFKFKGKNDDVRVIGQSLGASQLLEGSVREESGRLRISVQLIDVLTGFQLWAKTYEQNFTDVRSIQQYLVQAVIHQLLPDTQIDHDKLYLPANTANVEAYRLYLRGRRLQRNWNPADLTKSIDLFERATTLDRDYTPAFIELADSYAMLGSLHALPPTEAMPKAKEAVFRALKLHEGIGSAHSVLAYIYWAYEWNWSEAETQYKRAIALSPGDANAHQGYGCYLMQQGRLPEAMSEFRRAEAMDPLAPAIVGQIGIVAHQQGDFNLALDSFRKSLELEPGFYFAQIWRSRLYQDMRRPADALASLNAAVASAKDDPTALAELARAHALFGNFQQMKKLLKQLEDAPSRPYETASIFAAAGDNEKAVAWLEKAYEERQGNLVWLRVDPSWKSLRSDRRFVSIIERMRLIP